MIRFYSKKYHF